MDYDNNDFQGHNHKLSGEESSNLSPISHPYALPKFDFDDNLQTHLRFDTLVEDEVFLGISSQEDNQWIEDFSRGSSGIEFNSSTTESCSISRRNNVWYEATSSESVEMLLKSVGQEGVLEEAVIEEPDAGNELGRLTKEMEPILKQDNKVEENTHPKPALPPYNVTDGLEDSSLAEHPNVLCTSEAQRDDSSYRGCAGEVDSNLVSVVDVNEDNMEADRKCADANIMVVENSINKSLTDNMEELSSVSAVHIDMVNIENANSVSHNVILNSGKMVNQVTEVSAESVDALLIDNSKGKMEHNAQSKESNIVDEMLSGTADEACTDKVEYPHCVDSRIESLIEQNVEVNITTSEVPSGSPSLVDSHFHLLKESKYDMASAEPSQHFEAMVCSKGRELCNQFEGSPRVDSSVVCQGDRSPNEKVFEFSDTKAVSSACLEMEMDSVEEKKGVGNQMVSLEGQNIGICCNEVETSSCPELEMDSAVTGVSAESVDALLIDNSKGKMEHNAQSKESSIVNEMLSGTANEACTDKVEYPHCVDTRAESLIEQKVVVNITTSEVPSGSPINVGSHFHLPKESKYDMTCTEPSHHVEAMGCSKGRELCNQFEGSLREDSSVVCQGDRSPNEKVVEVRDTKAVSSACLEMEMGSVEEKKGIGNQMVSLEGQNIGICSNEVETSSCPELEMDSVVEKDKLFESNHQMDTNLLAEASVFVDHEPGKQDAGNAEDLSSLTNTCSSAEREQSLDENLIPEGCKLPLTHGESVKPKEQVIASEEGGVHSGDQVVSFNERRNRELQTESINMECKVVGSSHSDGCSEVNIIKPRGSDLRDTKEQAEEFTSNVQTSPVIGVMSVDPDKKYAAETEGHEDAGLLCLKESLEVPIGLKPVNEDGKASQSDQAAAEVGKECSEKLKVCSVSFDSTVKPVDGTAASESENHNEIPMERNAEATLVEVSEAMSVSIMAEPCLDQRRKEHEALVASETQITEQIGPSTKDEHQASIALACPSIYGSDSMNEDGAAAVCSIEDNCEVQQLKIKETTNDSFRHIDSIGADGTDKPVPSHPENEATRGLGSSFTFDVSPSEGKNSERCQSFPSVQVDEVQMVIKGPPFTSKSTQIDLKMVPEPQATVEGKARVGVKGTPERKTRRASGKATVRSAKKGNNVKEATPGRHPDKEDKSPVFMHTPGTGQLVQFKDLKPCGDVTKSGAKPLGIPPTPASNLPDLNTSVPPAVFFQQPFTDLQQVQLRAQIFIYGSLIQESAPDEACMISAFGPSEGGEDVWGPAWRACVERVQARKSYAGNMGTPIQPCSGGKAPDQQNKQGALQTKVLSSPAGRASSKGISSPAVTPIIPLSSPVWNVSTPSCDGLQSSGMPRGGPVDCHQSPSPLHSYQVPGTRNFVEHSPSWPSQSPFPTTWMTSPQTSTSDANARFSVFPNTEPVKLTPAKYLSVPSFPAMKTASVPAVPHYSSGAAASTGTLSQPDMSKVAAIPRFADPKPRKRKNVPAIEGSGHIPLLASNQGASVWPPGVNSQFSPVPEIVGQKLLLPQSRTESVPTAAVSTLFSTSVAVTAPDCFKSASSSGKFSASVSPSVLGNQPNRVDQNVEKSFVPEQTSTSSVEEAKLHAESAAAHAANAVSHYHDIWSQLAKQRTSGVISDVEAKFASSAVAITAATSVARAAAAAAMIASNVAVQAKLMADEVSSSIVIVDPTHSNSSSKATSSATLKSGDGIVHPSSIIAVAREAAKKRVEAASAASKHAENLDAIVKAAELAAEAVSQAGRILCVGGPLPLSELEELRPVSSKQGANKHIVDCDQPKAFSIELYNLSAEEIKGGSSGVEEAKKTGKLRSLEKECFKAQSGHKASELPIATGVVPEADAGPRSVTLIADDACANAAGSSIENGIEEGCLVEVFKDGGNYKAAWYSANILSLKSGKALLCYTDLQTEDGTGQLKEWVPLKGDSISIPTVRIAHPTTTMRFFDGTSRKRKAAVMDYSWSVGDRVDAWMQDCWREGVVKEKNKNDETTLTISFPALGDTSIVRVWHLRPTLTWKDGKWIEWSNTGQHSPPQGNVPQEKRARLGSPVQVKGKEKISRSVDLVESRKREESTLLPLSENEKEFNVGKNTMHENKQESHRTVRTGLQKEGSRVVFGIPKPGKKRKFMDVSKHFDSDKSSKNMKTGDSVKFARYVAPQVSGSRGWKNSTQTDFKVKQAGEDKPKVLRPGKPPSASGRTLSRKDNKSTSSKSTTRDATVTNRMSDDAISSEENDTSQENLMEFGSGSDSQDTSEGQTLICSLSVPRIGPRKGSSSKARSIWRNAGRSVPPGGRMVKKVEVSEVVEPRRSIRKIQPTARLLEGIQSSLTISKIPFAHDKNHRSQSRSKF